MYNVTYVKVYESTPTTVTCGYTAGYMGTFVLGMAVGAAIAYGTGYRYPPYVYWGPGQSLTKLGIHAPMAWGRLRLLQRRGRERQCARKQQGKRRRAGQELKVGPPSRTDLHCWGISKRAQISSTMDHGAGVDETENRHAELGSFPAAGSRCGSLPIYVAVGLFS